VSGPKSRGALQARRKAEIILEILRQTTTVIDAARQNDLTPSEVQEWVDTFLKGGEQSLKARAAGAQDQNEREIKEFKATIGASIGSFKYVQPIPGKAISHLI